MTPRHKITIVIIVLLALALRLLILFKAGDFWADEMFSFVYSQKPWADSFKFWVWETNPPLHLFFLKLWWHVFPPRELWARLPSLIFGLGAVLTCYRLGKKVFNSRVGLVAAWLLAFSPMHVYYSVTARAYSLLMFLGALSTLFFFKVFFSQEQKKHDSWLYMISAGLLLYTHLTGLFLLLAQGLVLLPNKEKLKKWLKFLIASLSAWLIWAAPALTNKLSAPIFQNSWFFNANVDRWYRLKALLLLTVGPISPPAGAAILLIFITLLAIMIYHKRRDDSARLFFNLLILLFVPVALPLALGLTGFKFMAVALPIFILSLGAVISHFVPKKLVFLLAVLIFLPGLFNLFRAMPLSDWGALDSYLLSEYRQGKKQALIYDNFTIKNEIDWYLRAPMPRLPFLITEPNDWDEFLIKQNYLYLNPVPEDLENWFVRNKLFEYDEIFILQGSKKDFISVDLFTLVKSHGYRENGPPRAMPVLNRPKLWLLKKT